MAICCCMGCMAIDKDDNIKETLEKILDDVVLNKNITEFHVAFRGGFARLCAECLNQLKEKYPQIERYKILSFPDMTSFQKEYYGKNYDGTIYLNFGQKKFRDEDRKRNQMMVDNSDFIIFYSAYYGRVSLLIEYAKQKKKEFINLGKFNP